MEHKRYAAALGLITAICLMGDSMLYIALPVYWNEIGGDALWQVGVLLSVNRFVRLPLNPVIGWLYANISVRTGLLVAIGLTLLTTSGYGLLSGFAWWIVLRSVWGLAWALLRTGAYLGILNATGEHNRGAALGMYSGVYRLGSLAGMAVGGFFVGWFGFQPVALVLGGLALLALPVCLILVPRAQTNDVSPDNKGKDSEARMSILAQLRLLWTHTNVIPLVTTGLLTAMVFDGLFGSALPHLIDVQFPVIAIAGMTFGAATLAAVLQAIRWGGGSWLSVWFGGMLDTVNRRAVVIGVLLSSGALLFAVIPFRSVLPVWGLLVVGVFAVSTMLNTTMDVFVAKSVSPATKVTVVTIHTLALDLGAALGPVIGYSFDIRTALWFSSALLVLLAGAWWTAALKQRRQATLSS